MIKRIVNNKQQEQIKENKNLKNKLEKLIQLLIDKKIISKEDLKKVESNG